MIKFNRFKILLLLTFMFAVNHSQAAFTITENYIFNAPSAPSCYSTEVRPDIGNWHSTLVNIVSTNNIQIPGNPNAVANLSQQAYRYIYFDIYLDDGNSLTLVKTIEKFQNYLYNGSHDLTVADLQGVPQGNIQIHLRTLYDHIGTNPYDLDLYLNSNGQENCYQPRFDIQGTEFACDFGLIDCIYWDPCVAVLTVTNPGTCWSLPGNTTPCYSYLASITGAVGPVSYQWTVQSFSGGKTGKGAYFQVYWDTATQGPGSVLLTATDEGTGCVYTWTSFFKTNGEKLEGQFEENVLEIGPNPIAGQERLTINYQLSEPGAVSIDIYDLSGKKLRNLYQDEAAPATEASIKVVPDLSPGYYLLGLQTPSGMTSQKLIITE